jgi:hypothetical protein
LFLRGTDQHGYGHLFATDEEQLPPIALNLGMRQDTPDGASALLQEGSRPGFGRNASLPGQYEAQ